MISCSSWNFCVSWVYISNWTFLVIIKDKNAAGSSVREKKKYGQFSITSISKD